jgi:predicted dinucleotide-binding enzyme
MKRIAVLGSGVVGQTLAEGFKKHGYEVRIGSRDPGKLADFAAKTGISAGTFGEIAAWAEALVLSVQGAGAEEALTLAGDANLRGKLVIDTTNPIADAPPVDGVIQRFTRPNHSILERLQAAHPDVRLVKAFNSVGSTRMVNPAFTGGRPTMFYCGNDAEAKAAVLRILEQFGWEPLDLGSAVAARAVEPLSQLWCIPGFRQNSWTHAFKVLWT